MAEQNHVEQLEQAVEALLLRRDAALAEWPEEIAPLAMLVADLLHVPDADFCARLKEKLERTTDMQNTSAAKAAREGFRTVTPYLVVERTKEFLAFLKNAFDAEELVRTAGSAGGIHAELRIGDSMLMAGGGLRSGSPIAIHLYVADADAVWQRAVAAGAQPFYEMTDMPYGDREGGVRDGFGNTWYIATHKATGHLPAGMHTITPTLHPHGADALLDFMRRGLGASEVECTRTPKGAVQHAQMRLGDSVIEVGEARPPIEATAAMILIYRPDVDAAYQQALAAGGTSIEAPADQPYGERRAGVKDAHGNSWYFSCPVARG